MSAEIIQFVPKPNLNRLSVEDERAIALFEYMSSAGYPVQTSEAKAVMERLKVEIPDTTPSDYVAPPFDCA